MTGVVDVAAYILRRYGPMTTMKLQKLAYYAQAEALSRHGRPLFDEDFQAWRGGPVCCELYMKHRGKFLIRDGELPADGGDLPMDDRRIVDSVCDVLSSMTGNDLSYRTHAEEPWQSARRGLGPSDSGSETIGKDSIREYYTAHPVVSE